jgi:hypothetical protein
VRAAGDDIEIAGARMGEIDRSTPPGNSAGSRGQRTPLNILRAYFSGS